MIGDGGQSGFDAADPNFRFHTFFNATPDVNFSKGDIADWNWIADPIFGTEPQSFYVPIITRPGGEQDRCSSAPGTSGAPRRGAWAR